MTLKRDVLHGLKWVAGARFASQLVSWIITIVVMRLLVPADYGLMAMASVFLAWCAMFVEMGLAPALVQAPEVSTDRLRQAQGIFMLANFVVVAVLLAVAPLAAHFFDEPRLTPLIRVMALQFVLTPFGLVSEVLLQRGLDFRARSLLDLTQSVVTAVVTLLLAWRGLGVWALVLGIQVAALWRTVAVNVVAPFPHLPRFSASGMRGLFAFGGKISASRLLWFVFTQADTVIIGRTLGGEILGVYSVALHLASLPVQRVSGILNQVAFPALARYQHDHAAIARQLLRAFELVSLLAFPLLWGMASTASDIVLVFLGGHWAEAILPLRVLCLIMPFRTVVQFLPAVTDAVGRPGIALQNGIVACTLMPLAFWCGTHWGIFGVAMAWALVYPVVLLVNLHRMLAAIGLTVRDVALRMLPAMLGGAAMCAAVAIAHGMLSDLPDRRIALALQVAVGALAYGLASCVCNRPAVADVWRMVRGKGKSQSRDKEEGRA
ncbi:O-antigen/teichoic acid export membrane protein [Pseudoduganella lurida]|uniref:O-antigen/teichoic acid export membrane protein n=1 Tax=Pseudoduganella lurida TaxID=1036180 RepID=A0A562R1U2_9BURK|nr:lipopolysaccharide biosynthesis protein [Pseudoduganella lurida]TWI63021.1 O-antigen/teichoic acid export membrane protein [Pseudoduganella lurida]